ncbi:MAG TPA: peptidoglycan DD-metalloendopeptidase family protein [Solirubrobacterales bacterium]
MNSRAFVRSAWVGPIGIAAVVALVVCLSGSALGATGGAGTPGSTPTAKGSPSGTPAASPSAGAITLVAAATAPRKSFYFGFRYPRLGYTIGSTQAENDLQIDVVNQAGEVVKTFYRENVAADVEDRVRWDGTTNEGRPARNGRYSFRVSPQSSASPAPAARKASSSTDISLGFSLFGYAFPILGGHEYGMSAGRFGAGRTGHTHQGQDVMATCGTPLVAARGGTVQYSGYQGAAGNYLVIDGRGTGNDFMYAHLAEPSPLQTGDSVRTGQSVGTVGETGDAQGCHLHFEIWGAPGWYEGGSPFDPLPYLEKWDAYS